MSVAHASIKPHRMNFIRTVATLAFLTTTAFAQIDDKAFLEQFEKTFEAGGNVSAKDFVPDWQMRGARHTVRPLAYNVGLNNTYFVDTASGVLEITGTPALFARIREIYALDYLRGLSKTEEFGKALGKSVESKIESVGGAVRDPVGTIKNVPKGASRFSAASARDSRAAKAPRKPAGRSRASPV